MESSPLFDLNKAIHGWRKRLDGRGSFGSDDLEELEIHLRDSAAELQAGGLSGEEAFRVAIERLGSDRRLAEEYAKANVRRIWIDRAGWMLGGVVASLSIPALVRIGVSIGDNIIGEWLGLDQRLIVTLNMFTQWTIWATAIGLGSWLVARRIRWLAGTVVKCFQRPVWTGVSLVIGLLALQILSTFLAYRLTRSAHGAAVLSQADQATLCTWAACAMALTRLTCITSIPLLAAYLWRATRTEGAPVPALTLDHSQPHERAVVDQLEAKGLSRSESLLVITLRRGYRTVSVEAKTRRVSGLWLERGLWMIIGAVVNSMVSDFVERPSWILVHLASSSSPLWQHLNGLVAMFLPLMLVGTAIAVFWSSVTSPQKRNGWLRRLYAVSPIRGAMCFAAVGILWVGVFTYLYWVRPGSAQFSIFSYTTIEIMWWMWKIFLIQFVLPIILLVWIGNRYQACQKSA